MDDVRGKENTPKGQRGDSVSDFAKVREGYRLILEGLGCDLKDPHFEETPDRAAKSLFYELCSGITAAEPRVTTFPLEGKSEMIISRGIPVRSLCAHHFLPFVGEAVVAYIPDAKILGLSKLSRLVDYWSRRPQVQEQLTTSIANDLMVRLFFPSDTFEGEHPISGDCGVGVIVKARHLCMEHRGVGHTSDVITSALRGVFLEAEVRAEFLKLAEG